MAAYSNKPGKESKLDILAERPKIEELIGQWSEEINATIVRREARVKEYNVNEMRAKGGGEQGDKPLLLPDETYIARRVIDKNVRQEKPEFVAFLEQAPRLVLFKSLSNPTNDTIALADWFTLGMKYEGWNIPWHRLFDCTSVHGAGFLELRVDSSKPFNLALKFTPREDLIFARKCKNSLQRNERILRRYEYFPNELEDAIENNGFNSVAVKRLTERFSASKRDEPIEVYQVFCKKHGIVYTSWYSSYVNDLWLKDPTPLFLGHCSKGEPELGMESMVTPLPSTFFPFVANLYELTEVEEILKVKGRASRDLADQDALSNGWTALINGTNRAVRLVGSYVNQLGAEQMQSETVEGNKIYSKQIDWFQSAYPDPMILQVLQVLSTENLAQAGKVDFAAINRKDSRKTATELTLATEQSGKLSSISIVPVANTVVEIYSMAWGIVQSQVMCGLLPMPEHIDPMMFQDIYSLAAAGDVEVVKRAEKMATLQQDLPLFAGTPVYPALLAKYLELRFPDEAPKLKEMMAGQDLSTVVQQLLAVLTSLPLTLPPDQKSQMDSIIQNAQSALNASGVPPSTSPVAGANPNGAPPSQPSSAPAISSGGGYVPGR